MITYETKDGRYLRSNKLISLQSVVDTITFPQDRSEAEMLTPTTFKALSCPYSNETMFDPKIAPASVRHNDPDVDLKGSNGTLMIWDGSNCLPLSDFLKSEKSLEVKKLMLYRIAHQIANYNFVLSHPAELSEGDNLLPATRQQAEEVFQNFRTAQKCYAEHCANNEFVPSDICKFKGRDGDLIIRNVNGTRYYSIVTVLNRIKSHTAANKLLRQLAPVAATLHQVITSKGMVTAA